VFNAYANIKGSLWLQDQSRLDGTAQIVVAKRTQWYGGRIGGGPSVLQCTGGLLIDGATAKTLDSRRVNCASNSAWVNVRSHTHSLLL
jgi:hypothetical protein